MAAKCRKGESGIIFKDGKARAVILDIDYYQELLERTEDAEDLMILMKLRQKPLKFRRFEDFLKAINYDQTIN